jgi:peptidoglycan/LPS O-acetylase OafA/YrhL
MSETTARIKHIDGLRALAVISVLLYHSTKSLPNAAWFFEGRHGVDLFFVISGFCLAYPVLNNIAKSGVSILDVPSFFAKRVVRIVPPYYAAILAFVALTAVLLALRVPLPDTMRAISPLDIVKQFFFFDYNTNFSNGSFWTLAVEARWYLLFPFVLWLWVNKRMAFWLAAAMSFSLYHFTRIGGTEFSPIPAGIDFATLPAFMLGIFAADLHVRGDSRARYALWLLPVLLLPTILVHHPGHVAQDTLDWQLISVCALIAVGHYQGLARIFAWAPLALIGVASYSIYLYHEPVIAALESALHVTWPVAALASLIVGMIAWYAIERRLQSPALRNAWVADLRAAFLKVFSLFDFPEKAKLAQAPIKAPSLRAVTSFLSPIASAPATAKSESPAQVGSFGIHHTIPELEV